MSRLATTTSSATVLLALGLTIGAHAQAARTDSDVQRVLDRARETYANLAVWHFEHKVVIQESEGAGQPTSVAEVTLVTANRTAPGSPAGVAPMSFCGDRCRLESRTGRGSVLIVRDGEATWLYSSAGMEYMKGKTLRDVTTSVSGSMLLGLHLTPLMSLREQELTAATMLSDEAVDIGGDRRDCYVVEGNLEPSSPFSSASAFLMLLQFQGLTDASYQPSPAGAAPARVRLWIDKERYFVLRRSVVENALKTPRQAAQTTGPGREVQVRLMDTFTVANVAGAVPDALFAFQPVAGAKEIPNIRVPRS